MTTLSALWEVLRQPLPIIRSSDLLQSAGRSTCNHLLSGFITIGGNLLKFWQKQICTVFWDMVYVWNATFPESGRDWHKLLLMFRATQVHAGTEQRQAGTGIQLAGAVPRRGPRPADSPLVPRRVAGCRDVDAATAGRGARWPGRAGVRPGGPTSCRTLHVRRFQPTRNHRCHRSNWRHWYVVTCLITWSFVALGSVTQMIPCQSLSLRE